MGLLTWLRTSRRERKFLKCLSRIPFGESFPLEKKKILLNLVRDKKFKVLLEYLELTISDKLVMFSSIDILDESRRMEAIRVQQQMRGVYLVIDILESLINNLDDTEEGTLYEEDEKE